MILGERLCKPIRGDYTAEEKRLFKNLRVIRAILAAAANEKPRTPVFVDDTVKTFGKEAVVFNCFLLQESGFLVRGEIRRYKPFKSVILVTSHGTPFVREFPRPTNDAEIGLVSPSITGFGLDLLDFLKDEEVLETMERELGTAVDEVSMYSLRDIARRYAIVLGKDISGIDEGALTKAARQISAINSRHAS